MENKCKRGLKPLACKQGQGIMENKSKGKLKPSLAGKVPGKTKRKRKN